jgi:hypothetical protein
MPAWRSAPSIIGNTSNDGMKSVRMARGIPEDGAQEAAQP